jgi:hypothetical protein
VRAINSLIAFRLTRRTARDNAVHPKREKGLARAFETLPRISSSNIDGEPHLTLRKLRKRKRQGKSNDIKIKFRATALASRPLRLIEKISLPRRKRDETLSEEGDRTLATREIFGEEKYI